MKSKVVREAQEVIPERPTPAGQDRLALLREAKGIWKDRVDLPDFVELRKEMDRMNAIRVE